MNIKSAPTYNYQLTDNKLITLNDNNNIMQIYENDLKYKNFTNIDIKRIDNKQNENEDRDTIEYRFKECLKEDNKTLDLSHLSLKVLQILPKNIYGNIKYLFLSENKLTLLDDLSYLNNLLVLDLCNNNLVSLPILPEKVQELTVRYNNINNINSLSNNCNLKRLDVSNNNIQNMPIIDSLEILICNNNRLKFIPNLQNLKKLTCQKNEINTISSMYNLNFLDCEENNIMVLENFNNLIELYCKTNKIITLRNLNKIEVIHCQNNPLTRLEFFYNLYELVCNSKSFSLSKMYNIRDANIYNDDIMRIYFK